LIVVVIGPTNQRFRADALVDDHNFATVTFGIEQGKALFEG